MPSAQDIYDTLVKDPDLEIGENQTREEAAQSEADFRARQYVNNVRALSLATAPLEEVSPIKALLQHVSSISKTIVSGSISIAQNILKMASLEKSMGIGSTGWAKKYLQKFSESIDNEKVKEFINIFANSLEGGAAHENEYAALHMQKFLVDLEKDGYINDPDWPEAFLEDLAGDSKFAYDAGIPHNSVLGKSFHTALKKNGNYGMVQTPFKPESIEAGKANGVDYKDVADNILASEATISDVNSTLSKMGEPYSKYKIGTSKGYEDTPGSKLKILNEDGYNLTSDKIHNPFPDKSPGRLYQGMMGFKSPSADEINTGHIDEKSLPTFSVADMVNAVHWLVNQETPEQAQAVIDAKQINEEALDAADKYEDSVLPATSPTTSTENVGKTPFVMFGSWGYHKHGAHGMSVSHENKHQAHVLGMEHGICNELGQVNKVGQALIDAAVEDNGLKAGEHYINFGSPVTHKVLKAAGVEALCDHHGIDTTTGLINKAVAYEIADMELMAEQLPDGLDWESAMNAVVAATPLGGVSETPELQALVEKTAAELKVSPTPELVGNDALALKAGMQATTARLQAAYQSGDSKAIAEYTKLFGEHAETYATHVGEAGLGDITPLDAALEGLGEEYHEDFIKNLDLLVGIKSIMGHLIGNKIEEQLGTKHLETLQNLAAAHMQSVSVAPSSPMAGDPSLKELHTAMDTAEDEGMDPSVIDTAVKDSMKEAAIKAGVPPGDVNTFVSAVSMPQNWPVSKNRWELDQQIKGEEGYESPAGSGFAGDKAHATLEEKAKNLFDIHERNLAAEGFSPGEIKSKISNAEQEMKDAINALASTTNPEIANKAAKQYLTDNYEKVYDVGIISMDDWLGEVLTIPESELFAEEKPSVAEPKDEVSTDSVAASSDDAEKVEHLETLKNLAAAHVEATPTTAGWDSSLKELHTAMDNAEGAGVDVLDIDTAVKDSMKEVALESGVQPGNLTGFITTAMSHVNWKADKASPMITIHGAGDTGWKVGDKVNVAEFEAANKEIQNEGGLPASSKDYDEKSSVAEPEAEAPAESAAGPPDTTATIAATNIKRALKKDIANKAEEYIQQKGTGEEEQALKNLHSAMNDAQSQSDLSAEDINNAVKDQLFTKDYGAVNLLDESSEQEETEAPAEPEAEAPAEPKGKTHEEKLDKVMTTYFGEDWKEQAETNSDISTLLESYGEGEEGQKDLASDYKKHHIEAIKNKALDAVEDAKQAKEDEATAVEDAKQANITARKDKVEEEANTLPSEPGDLDDMAKLDGKETVTPEVATSQARELMAHQKKHAINMSPEAKNKLGKGLLSAMKHGADLAKLKKEMVEQGDNFGSPEHLQETHEKDMKAAEFKENHEKLISGKEGQQAREDAFHAGAHNKFTEFDEDGNPKHDIHVETDENGKAQKFDKHEPEDYKTHEESQKKFHTDKGHALHDSHMLHTMSEKQEEYHDEYKKAKGEYDAALAPKKFASASELTQSIKAKAAALKNLNEKKQALEDSGVPIKDVENQDDEPKSGPPNPEVARQKMAQGYVWHEETRHWILKDTLKELQGGHGGHDASIISSSHGGIAGKAGAFALDEHGNASPGTNFMYHGSGNLMKVGTGKPPAGGSASHATIAGNALHRQLSSGGHLGRHGDSATGITKIPNFTHPTKGSAGSSGIGTKAAKDVPTSKLGSTMDNLKEGKGFGLTSYLDSLFSKKGYPMPKGSALALFVKAYGSHDAMKHKKEIQGLLEQLSESDEESDNNSVEKGIISYR